MILLAMSPMAYQIQPTNRIHDNSKREKRQTTRQTGNKANNNNDVRICTSTVANTKWPSTPNRYQYRTLIQKTATITRDSRIVHEKIRHVSKR